MTDNNLNTGGSSVKHIRLLKPSFVLYLLVGILVLIVAFIITYLFTNLATVFVISALIGLSPLILIKPFAYMIARHAESKGCGLNYWFVPDVEREKLHYGPLRAHRLFGHPIGRTKWF
jgi:positive regulator of sigma E activity